MVEEKMKILKMLEEGKITADEAVNLLNSLDGKITNKNKTHESRDNQQQKKTESYSMDIDKKIEALSKDLAPKIEKAAKTVIDKANSFADKISKSLSSSTSSSQKKVLNFEMYVVKGDNSQLRLKCKNGKIHIKGYNGDKITAKIEYNNNENSRIELLRVDNTYYLNYDEAYFTNVAIEAFVPEFLFSKIYLETTNSSVFVDGLTGDEIDIAVNNGPIELKNISAKNVKLETTNGNIHLENITGRLLHAESSNGFIDIKLSDVTNMNLITSNGEIIIDSSIRELKESNTYEWKAETSNATIKVNTLKGFDIAYDIKALTSLNEIQINMANIDFIENEKSYIKAITNNYHTALKKVNINLETSNAPITLF